MNGALCCSDRSVLLDRSPEIIPNPDVYHLLDNGCLGAGGEGHFLFSRKAVISRGFILGIGFSSLFKGGKATIFARKVLNWKS